MESEILIQFVQKCTRFKKESKTVWKHVLGNLEHDTRVPPTKWEQTLHDIHPKSTPSFLSNFVWKVFNFTIWITCLIQMF